MSRGTIFGEVAWACAICNEAKDEGLAEEMVYVQLTPSIFHGRRRGHLFWFAITDVAIYIRGRRVAAVELPLVALDRPPGGWSDLRLLRLLDQAMEEKPFNLAGLTDGRFRTAEEVDSAAAVLLVAKAVWAWSEEEG